MTKIIGISGYKQSGKDTVCNILMECFSTKHFRSIHRIGIFDAAKREIALVLGTTVEQLNKAKVEHLPVRQLLQSWGDYKKEQYGPNYFIDQLALEIKQRTIKNESHLVIIPDVRFSNEAAFIKERGGVLLKIDRTELQNTDKHPSETTIDGLQQDWFIRNHGSLNDLKRDVIWISQFIKERWQLC